MKAIQVSSGVTAFVRPEEGANASLIRTAAGAVVVDTTSCAAELRALLAAAQVVPDDVCLVVNTHQHSDHTWGNQLFDCPILAHRLCKEAMTANLDSAWNLDSILASISDMFAYVRETWSRTVDHLTQGHSVDEAAADPGYPRYAEGAAERYHKTNIRVMYAQLAGEGACPL